MHILTFLNQRGLSNFKAYLHGHIVTGSQKMGEAFRSLELVVMPVQAMFPNPQKLSKDTKQVQDMQDTLKCAPIRKYFTALTMGVVDTT